MYCSPYCCGTHSDSGIGSVIALSPYQRHSRSVHFQFAQDDDIGVGSWMDFYNPRLMFSYDFNLPSGATIIVIAGVSYLSFTEAVLCCASFAKRFPVSG